MTKRILFFLNSISVILHLVCYLFSFIPPSKLYVFASVTLFIPVFIIINIVFVIYWLIKLDKKAFLSLVTLIICIKDVRALVGINFNKEIGEGIFKIQTYNSHYFNLGGANFFNTYKKENIYKNANIIGFQECYFMRDNEFKSEYSSNSFFFLTGAFENHTNMVSKNKVIQWGYLPGFSKKRKSVPFAVFGDVEVGNKVVRFYSTHFHSFHFPKEEKEIQGMGWKFFLRRLNSVFIAQEEQLKELNKHIKESPYEVVIMGDFNNNAFSYLYKKLKREHNLKDTFISEGGGFGSSFDFKYFPLRIDFILVPESAKVYSHKVTKTKKMSDHFPVTAEISFE